MIAARPGALAVVFMILPSMILLNPDFGFCKIVEGKIMKTKTLTSWDQLAHATKRGSDYGLVPIELLPALCSKPARY